MQLLSQVMSFFRCLRRRQETETELDDEILSHVDLLTEERIRDGASPEEASRTVRIELGGVEQVKEKVREVRTGVWFDTLFQDVRFGVRMLWKSPGFTITAALTLALGIGANTAIFSVVDQVLLAPLPYRQPDRLVMVWESNPRFPMVAVSYPNFVDRQRDTHSFEQMAAYARKGSDLTNPGTPDHLDGSEISSGFFGTLGVKLLLGRDFSPIEDTHGGAPVAILSNELWRERFGGKPEALGKAVTLDGVDHAIVGVLPSGFRFWDDSDVFTPIGQDDSPNLNSRGGHWIFSIARLKSGTTISAAQAELSAIQTRLDQLYPDANRDIGIALVPLKQQIVGDVRGTLLLLLGAVGLVLLIACANVANLVLARSAGRSGEFAVRSALGARRSRVVRQLLTESLLLALIGGGLGILIYAFSVTHLLSFLTGVNSASFSLPLRRTSGINAPVLFFTLGLTSLVAFLSGLAPALKTSTTQASLNEAGRGFASSHQRAQNILVVTQISLALVLLVGASLLFRTIRHLWEESPGFDTEDIITFKVGVSHSLTQAPGATRVVYQQLMDRIREIPGVQAADFADPVPLTGEAGTVPFWMGSEKPVSLQAAPRLVGFITGPDYLRTTRIPLLRGRFFSTEDTIKSPCVVVIDDAFVHMYFKDRDPIGQTVTFGFAPTPPCRIVGIVGHVKAGGINDSETPVQNQLYFPMYQDPDRYVADNYAHLSVVVRTSLDIATILPAIKNAVERASSDQPIFDVQSMHQIQSKSMSPQEFPMALLGVFALLALLLASVGIFGVVSYSVAQREQEIGIRMALGAEKRALFWTVIGRGIRLALCGLAIGITVALVLTRLLPSFSHLLYGVRTTDPLTFGAVSFVLMCVVGLACYIPAWRAMRVDPIVALRHE